MLCKDIYPLVLKHVRDAPTYKALMLVSRGINTLMIQFFPNKEADLTDHLGTLIMLFPTLEAGWAWSQWWDFKALSKNWSISINAVLANLDEPWSWRRLTLNHNISLEDMVAHPELPWKWPSLISSPKLTKEFYLAHPEIQWGDEPPYHFFVTAIAWEDNDYIIRKPRHISLEALEADIHGDWDWEKVSDSPLITWEFVSKHRDVPWCVSSLSYNPNFNLDVILANPDFPWDWHNVSMNPSISWEDVRGNPQLPWDYHTMSFHHTLDWETALKERHWDYELLSSTRAVPMKVILANQDAHWDWELLSGHPGLTWRIIASCPGRWCWNAITHHDFHC